MSRAMVGRATMIMPPSMEPMSDIPEMLVTMRVARHLEMEALVCAFVRDSVELFATDACLLVEVGRWRSLFEWDGTAYPRGSSCMF